MHGNNSYQEGTLGQILDNIDADVRTINKEKEINAKTIDAAGNIADNVNSALNSQKISASSIVARARNSIMQFPIYVPPTIRVNEIHIISKLFEKVYADLVSSVISQYPIIDEDEANNLGFLKKFHTNIMESADSIVNKYYQPIDMIDAILTESVFHEERLSDTCVVEFARSNTNDEIDHLIISESKRLGSDALEGFGYYFKEDSNNVDTTRKTVITNNELSDDDIGNIISSDKTILVYDNEKKGKSEKDISDLANYRFNNLTRANKINIVKSKISKGELGTKYTTSGGKYYQLGSAERQEITTRDKGIIDAPDTPMLLKDSDIKKTNGMAPFKMQVTFRVRNKNGVETKEVKYILGIKTILHVIRTQDLADELRDLIMGNERTLQKVRYKTGEITFMDYLFNLKGLKADALKRTNTNKRWLGTLKRLSDYSKLNGTMFKKGRDIVSEFTNGSTPIPNGTLILTQADVLFLTSSTGIDLSVVSNAKKLANNLFLIAIAIVDSTAGTMKVLFPDTDNSWDVQSLAAIDAEIAKTDNSNLMKELNKMVNK